ncbi:MAG: hypothetical protein ACXVHL_35955 [Solirubrobacteraceae bacterium]
MHGVEASAERTDGERQGKGDGVSPATAIGRRAARPKLVFSDSNCSGRCRRAEGFLTQVLQHRRNHHTFELFRISMTSIPRLARHYQVTEVATICIVEGVG